MTFSLKGITSWALEYIVTIIFVLFVLFGFLVSRDISMNFFLNELNGRIFRNTFLVLSLIIPVMAGLGLNFGIVIGAMSGQAAIAIARYHELGGVSGMLFCFVVSFFFAALCGYFTGKLYNRTRGQEMIAGLIVGYFANGIYQFLFLFAVGGIIKVPATHPMIIPSGVGIRMTVDLVPAERGGLKYVLDNIYQVPFVYALLAISLAVLATLIIGYCVNRRRGQGYKNRPMSFGFNVLMCVTAAGIAVHAIAAKSNLMKLRPVPVVTGLLIIALCVFTELIMKTKLGQDFRAVGQNRHVAEVSGIDVDRTRIIATMISTVLAAWGQLIFLQNMGTLSTYSAHTQIGLFSVAALLVGGASASRASIKNAVFGAILFNAMFIMSPEIGQSLFGQAVLGEYFRTFLAYGVIGVALGLHVWKANNRN
ncbi:MAG: ABC transporter permease [Synergistaceae bacterium]|nr:ABC transporter permease [Synergistaceae bacterium]